MVGIRLIIIMAVVGGFIAYVADKMGSRIGKRKMSVFGLRPKYTALLLTVVSGIMISVLTIGVMAVASDSARTALFGMEKLQRELLSLNGEKQAAAEALDKAKLDIEGKNKAIGLLDEQIKTSEREQAAMETRLADINGKYGQAQAEVAQLTESKKTLNAEIAELEESTERLRKGLLTLREGKVFYRAGEVVYAGIMRGGLQHEENVAQVNWLLKSANEAVLQRLQIKPEQEDLQIIWISSRSVENAVEVLDKSKANKLFRLRTYANIILGELVACDIEIADNNLIFAKDELICSEEYDLSSGGASNDAVLMTFLSQVNHRAVEAGVLPDPITGKVGSMDAATMIEASNNMRRLSGRVLVQAYARTDITTAGPVLVRLEVAPVHE